MKLLSWNIQWGRGLDGRVDLARTAATIRALGEFDVICLQEVAVNFAGLAGSRGEDGVTELARGLPGYTPVYAAATDLPDGLAVPPARKNHPSHSTAGPAWPAGYGGGEACSPNSRLRPPWGPSRSWVGPAVDLGGGRKLFGNALFSRLPVGQVFRHALPWPADPTVPSMARVLLEAVVLAPGGPLRVLTTHLEYYSPAIRAAQVEALRALHAEACAQARQPRRGEGEAGGSFEVLARPASAVLCGDMNFPAGAPEHVRLLAPYDDATPAWRDSWQVLHGAVPHAPTVGIQPVDFVDRPSCFDFVLLTEDLAPRLREFGVDAETTASDHQPVWIELAL